MAFGLVNQVFADESFDADVRAYTSEFENMSASAMGLTKTLLYQMDNLAFPEALETGADVNVIARLTDDCQQKVAKFLQKS
jgi:methylglutaconyl-CoA hydratase